MFVRKCDYCGREYAAKRSTSRFCSDHCRNYSRIYTVRREIPTVRQNQNSAETAKTGPRKITRRQIADSVVAIRGGAQTLHAGADLAPEDLRDLCRVLSIRVLNALDEVGL